MREITFLKTNAGKWKKFENYLGNQSRADPDKLAELFTELTDDLSFAKTFYPESNTAEYLNGLAVEVHQKIYVNKKEKREGVFYFWKVELPLTFYAIRWQLLWAFLVFLAFVLIGGLSMHYDNSFARLVMGDSYIDMTLENIKNGQPMGVYKHNPPLMTFLEIAFNNVSVMLLAFATGIFIGFGSAYSLMTNGIMVGCFQYFFVKYNMGFQSAIVLWLHGTLEISCCIMASAAGFSMGNGLLFPGTYTRAESFKRGAIQGAKVAAGIVPIIITAAFFEGFVTRHTEMPHWINISIIAISFLFILFYFVFYPFYLGRYKNVQPV